MRRMSQVPASRVHAELGQPGEKVEGGQGGGGPAIICTCGDTLAVAPHKLKRALWLLTHVEMWEAKCLGCGVTWHVRREEWGK